MTAPETRTIQILGTCLAAWQLLFGALLRNSFAQETTGATPLTAHQVVEKMVARNQQRAEALKSYGGTRVYHLEFHGLTDKSADVVVKMSYQWPGRKEFTTLSETGSKTLRDRVVKRLVKAEVEAMKKRNREQSAIHPDNYEFRLVGYERTPRREFYVLQVSPRVRNKFLFRGRIWVDGQDFGIVRLEGEPAKNPSWWTTKIDIQHSYQKKGDFWLPARNETITQVRFFGRALLTIEYRDYELVETQRVQPPSPVEEPTTVSVVSTN